MRLTKTQKTLLSNLTATSKASSAELAKITSSYPGPMARCAFSLVQEGLLKQATTKDGTVVFSRTAAGGKALKEAAKKNGKK